MRLARKIVSGRVGERVRGIGGLASGESRVNACAECSLAFFTVAAAAVRDVKGHYNSVALFEERHARAEFFNYAHVFVALKRVTITTSAANFFGRCARCNELLRTVLPI
jgi:hypothetical protein